MRSEATADAKIAADQIKEYSDRPGPLDILNQDQLDRSLCFRGLQSNKLEAGR